MRSPDEVRKAFEQCTGFEIDQLLKLCSPTLPYSMIFSFYCQKVVGSLFCARLNLLQWVYLRLSLHFSSCLDSSPTEESHSFQLHCNRLDLMIVHYFIAIDLTLWPYHHSFQLGWPIEERNPFLLKNCGTWNSHNKMSNYKFIFSKIWILLPFNMKTSISGPT